MLIQCTKKLLEKLDIKKTESLNEELLFSWHANLITLNRRKTVVLVNDSNRYAIILHGLKQKDFNKLSELILKAIEETLNIEGIKKEVIDKYINSSKSIIFTKTKNRSLVAKMNNTCDTVYFYEREFEDKSVIQAIVSTKISNYISKGDEDKYFHPNEKMYEDLELLYGGGIFSCKVVKLNIWLDFENIKVSRKIIVPLNISFKNLHTIIQKVFGWKDYHLHNFDILEKDRIVVSLVCDEDDFNYPRDNPMILDRDVKLSEYIPKHSQIKYTYDFGDNWIHNIDVEEVISDYDKNHPQCIEAIGTTPPEDVGGEGAYENFLEIISDPLHEDYEMMINWSKSQGYKDINIEWVNRSLKSCLKWREIFY